MFTRAQLTVLSIAFGATSTALCRCAGTVDPDAEETASIQAALEAENGGMTTAAEAPAFAEEEVLTVSELSSALADTQDLVSPVMGQAGATSYHVLLLWGHLPRAHDQQ